MAASPRWKVYDKDGNYQAAVKEVEAAACLVDFYGLGATIRNGHNSSDIMWNEGREEVDAHESYDTVASTVHDRYMKAYPRSRA